MLETYGKGKGVEEAINKLIEISKNRKILITVIGGPVERISKIRSVLTENNIDFIVKDRIPSYEVPIEMKRLDIGIVPYPNEEHMSLYASPLKFFEYAAAGAAILSSDIQSHLDLKDLNLGIHYFEESNWNDFETKIIELIDNKDLLKILQNKSQENIEEHTWDKRIEKILNCMRL